MIVLAIKSINLHHPRHLSMISMCGDTPDMCPCRPGRRGVQARLHVDQWHSHFWMHLTSGLGPLLGRTDVVVFLRILWGESWEFPCSHRGTPSSLEGTMPSMDDLRVYHMDGCGISWYSWNFKGLYL